jgi:excisionase family DNA binding protein
MDSLGIPMARAQRITSDEIQIAFNEEAIRLAYPPILSPEQLAQLLGVSRSTIYLWIAQGRFRGAVTRIGKHTRIWRNRAIERLFNRGKPNVSETNTQTNRGIDHDINTNQ